MKKELKYFNIENAYGGCQEWFNDYMMKIGGCAIVAACDSSIYFNLYNQKEKIYPFNVNNLSKKDYIKFAKMMKPYLKPRWGGIDSLDLYIEGFEKFLKDYGETSINMKPFYGDENIEDAKDTVIKQIDQGYPIPCLILRHKNRNFDDYVWHWFLLAGYENFEDTFMVKAITYGSWRWLDFDELWNSGHKRKGGLIVYY